MGIQKNSKDGQFWANAAHFLFCSEIQGYEFFYQNVHIDLNEKKFPIDKLVTAFSQKMKNCLLKVCIFCCA
jgi:hypothetical protein